MAIHTEPEPGRWLNERMAALRADENWQPNAEAALTRLRAQLDTRQVRKPRWLWAAVLSTAAGFALIALPAPRALAARCLTCTVALWQSLAAEGKRASLLSEKSRRLAPDFALADDTGHLLRLTDLKGKVVLLNFWATWCHGCKTEIPWFIEFQRAYSGRRFVVVGLSRDDDGWNSVRPYLSQKHINYRMVIGPDALAAAYGADRALPVTILIDRSGRIAVTHTGVIDQRACRAEIEALL